MFCVLFGNIWKHLGYFHSNIWSHCSHCPLILQTEIFVIPFDLQSAEQEMERLLRNDFCLSFVHTLTLMARSERSRKTQ